MNLKACFMSSFLAAALHADAVRAQCDGANTVCSSAEVNQYVPSAGTVVVSEHKREGRFVYVDFTWDGVRSNPDWYKTDLLSTLEPDLLFTDGQYITSGPLWDYFAEGWTLDKPTIVVSLRRLPCAYIDTAFGDDPNGPKPAVGSACARFFEASKFYYSWEKAFPGGGQSSKFGFRFQRGKWEPAKADAFAQEALKGKPLGSVLGFAVGSSLGEACRQAADEILSSGNTEPSSSFLLNVSSLCVFSCCNDNNHLIVDPAAHPVKAPGCLTWKEGFSGGECAESQCDNHQDDDWDGVVDCDDSDCRESSGCLSAPCSSGACSSGSKCPGGYDSGYYCGNSSLGQNSDYLYLCEVRNGAVEYSVSDDCGGSGCEVKSLGTDDSCYADPIHGSPDECTSGPCCSDGNYASASTVCQIDAEEEYGCPWGTNCGVDVGVRYRDRYCSGSSSSCVGGYGPWKSWLTADSCSSNEACSPGRATCNDTASCSCACTSGPCCDGCNYYLRSSDHVCSSWSVYQCEGSNPGQDAQYANVYRYCSGVSPTCGDGPAAPSSWLTLDNCSSSEVCNPGSPPSCIPYEPSCGATTYWDPVIPSDIDTAGLQATRTESTSVKVEVEESGSGLRARVCKGSGTFMSDVAFHIYDAADGSGFVEVRSLATTGRTCSDRIDILNSSGYADGQQFGGVWQVVSPASSASDWGFPNAGCSVSGSPGGTCWNGTNITMTRTCR